jgi:hypothetical protein
VPRADKAANQPAHQAPHPAGRLRSIISVQQDNALAQPSAWFATWCSRLGMSPDAAFFYARIHVQPHILVSFLFGSVAACLLILPTVYVWGFPWFQWPRHGVALTYLAAHFSNMCLFWRRGPKHSSCISNKILLFVMILSVLGLAIPSFVGPPEESPFSNRLIATVAVTAFVWFFIMAGKCGGSEADIPLTPHTSMRPILLAATWLSLRVMDPVTDMVLVRMMLDLVRVHTECYRVAL